MKKKKHDSSTSTSRSRSAEHHLRKSDSKVMKDNKQISSRSDSRSRSARHTSRKSDYKTKKSRSIRKKDKHSRSRSASRSSQRSRPDLIKEGPKLKVINQEWTNIKIVCHQGQGHHQGQMLDLLIKRKSGPDVLNQRSISKNVIYCLVQNHSQDLVQGQGHTEQRQGQGQQKEDHIIIHHIQTLIQIRRWIDILQHMEIPENIQRLCVLTGRRIGYLLKRSLTVTEKL